MRARRLQIYARRQIFQNHSLRPSLSLAPFVSNCFGGVERRTVSRGRATIITRWKGLQENDKKKERKTGCARTHRANKAQPGAEIYIRKFKLSIRNDRPRATTRIRVDMGEVEGSRPKEEDGEEVESFLGATQGR